MYRLGSIFVPEIKVNENYSLVLQVLLYATAPILDGKTVEGGVWALLDGVLLLLLRFREPLRHQLARHVREQNVPVPRFVRLLYGNIFFTEL